MPPWGSAWRREDSRTERKGKSRMAPTTSGPDPPGRTRLDKWLWAARFFRTRGLAVEAVAGGKVQVNGDRAKPARAIRVGDRVSLRLGPYRHDLLVRALTDRRGSARVAATLYEECPESVTERARVAAQLKQAGGPVATDAGGRPTKRQRRRLERFRQQRGRLPKR